MNQSPDNPAHRLAIVIPAYKATYLPAALDSIAAQTCQDFTLYVGDDCSPEPIGSIVGQYQDKMNLVYQRFDTNLGGTDLVAQWERCIAMSKEEPYIWLFSDDDVMEPDCVEKLFKQIERTNGAYDLYHFDVSEIDGEGRVTQQLPAFPPVLGSYDYYKGKFSGRWRSYVVENVFSRYIHEKTGGFRNFDLAWGSDVATWCIFCGQKGMCKVPDARIGWRRSSYNITPNKTRAVSERKTMALCNLFNWSFLFFKNEEDLFCVNRKAFVRRMRSFRKHISRKCFHEAFRTFFNNRGNGFDKVLTLLQIVLSK